LKPKVIHLFTDSIYTVRFLHYLEENFDTIGHLVFVYCSAASNNLPIYLQNKICLVCYNEYQLITHLPKFKVASKIIVHQLNYPRLSLFWILVYPAVFKKMIWSVWGGDLYDHLVNKSLIGRINEYIKTFVVRRISYIATFIEEEYALCIQRYESKAKLLKCSYPGVLNLDLIAQEFPPVMQSSPIKIQVGNSADPTNNHIDVLASLSKFKDENIEIIVILSYGGTELYVNNVKEYGVNLFGSKIRYIENYMDSNQYNNLLAQIDIAVFNHEFQQGLGNIKLLLSIYKKVFVRQNTTTYLYYNRLGFNIFPTDLISQLSFNDFIEFNNEMAIRNHELLKKDSDEKVMLDQWKIILE
jgi:dTDP-N-acetylfucosamine:lipid II N-acetylfucosaminyltransferase